MKETKHLEWMDSLRVISTIAVILIHVATPVLKMAFHKNMEHWWVGNVMDAAIRFAVPMFLLLSGATLLTKDYKLGDFYKRRMTKVFLPFLFWFVIYYIYLWLRLPVVSIPHSFVEFWTWVGAAFMKNGVSVHFWFMYMLMFLYLIIPFLSKGIRMLSQKQILVVLLLWFGISLLAQCKYIDLSSSPILSRFLYYTIYAGYLVLGYYLRTIAVSTLLRYAALIGFVASTLFVAYITFYLSEISGKLILDHQSYLSFATIFQTIAVFILFKDYEVKNKLLCSMRTVINDFSFGIYLAHVLFLNIFWMIGFKWTVAHPLLTLPAITLSALVLSILLLWSLRKIPYAKPLIG